ncbi:MAG: fused MFS/spermidine synthase [Alphaproteobacteria bacterium]|nr:fused MFS/spermidine synthase [Alphaproteobacteria bacterium]
MAQKDANSTIVTLAVFSFTLFLSASLMFSVQPMAGKMLLPLVGGTPAGWIVAMAFFQVMLLAGYLIAHALSKFPSQKHGLAYVAALLAGVVFLPVALDHAVGSGAIPEAGRIFLLLTQALAVPFIALSATSSTLQRLFMNTRHGSSGDPYFLYAASNLGSFAGLLLYPLLVEPQLTLAQQAQYFTGGYALLILLAGTCVWFARGPDKKAAKPAASEKGSAATGKRQLEWLALAFIPSCLLMGVTTYITSDVISAPLVWILPLALYLLTFVIAFSSKPIVSLRVMEAVQPYTICLAVIVISLLGAKWLFSWPGVAFYITVFTLVALACHARLASLRPLNDGRQLTSFYLMMSIGGALGGVLNAFVIPTVFNRVVEFPLTLLASFLIHKEYKAKSVTGMLIAGLLLLSILLVNVQAPDIGVDIVDGRRIALQTLCLVLAVGVIFFLKKLTPAVLVLGTLVVFMVSQYVIADRTEILSIRNFYGTVRLYDKPQMIEGKTETVRSMRHGSTTHGIQVQSDQELSMTPTAYFTRKGPVGDVFGFFKPKKVAVLGLGIGTMNCYNEPYREFTFFEIDPAVVQVAEDNFTFLSACKSKKPPVIKVGDGRLELAKIHEKFDLLFMDAFTSDSIPAHLLTREALQLYMDSLTPNGVIAINVSNRYFALWDTIATTASTIGLKTEMKADTKRKLPAYASPSLWLMLSRDKDKITLAGRGWHVVKPKPDIRPWTDDYTSLLGTLSFDVAARGGAQ